jgi:hypothetical protein
MKTRINASQVANKIHIDWPELSNDSKKPLRVTGYVRLRVTRAGLINIRELTTSIVASSKLFSTEKGKATIERNLVLTLVHVIKEKSKNYKHIGLLKEIVCKTKTT